MAIGTRIRQLPPAEAARDDDVIPISQTRADGRFVTRGITWATLMQRIIDAVSLARQQLVDSQAEIDIRQDAAQGVANEAAASAGVAAAETQAALVIIQQMQSEGGESAYEFWLSQGNTGTINDFLTSLRGAQGDPGAKGDKGDKGDTGEPGQIGLDGGVGPKGDRGDAGPVGATGATGPAGPAGATGTQGAPGTPAATLIGTATVGQTAVLALGAGVRKVSVDVPGVVPGGNYLVFPVNSTPAGYALADAVCVSAGVLQVSITAPLLAAMGSFSIPVRVVRINT